VFSREKSPLLKPSLSLTVSIDSLAIHACSNEEWWCRHCHNESKYQQEDDWRKKHELDRKCISEVVCALCSTRQAVGSECALCGVSFGAYACTKCPFYDDDLSKQTYHCDACGICRVGGRGNYFHCPTCGSCYASNLRVGGASPVPVLNLSIIYILSMHRFGVRNNYDIYIWRWGDLPSRIVCFFFFVVVLTSLFLSSERRETTFA